MSTINYEQVNRSPSNNSPSKQLYSFPKSIRFGGSARNLTDAIGYDLPSTKSRRSAGFGFGQRMSVEKRYDGPPPGSYEVSTNFFDKPNKQAYSFGISRESYSKVYNEKNVLPDSANPGPGTYKVQEMCGKEGK